MIALITAVDQENALLRQQLTTPQQHNCAHLNLTSGSLNHLNLTIATCGIGKANTAAATALLIQHVQPTLVVMIGCGGAFADSDLQLGDLAIASEEIYADEGVMTPEGFLDMAHLKLSLADTATTSYFNRFPVDQPLAEQACRLLGTGSTRCISGPFSTVSTCSGTDELGRQRHQHTHAMIENMEGAAAAHQCLLNQTRFFELRSVSNFIEQRDLSRWDLPRAMTNAQKAFLSLVDQGLFNGLSS